MGNSNSVYELKKESVQLPYTYITRQFAVSGRVPLSFKMAKTLGKIAEKSMQSKSCEEEG